MCNNALEYSK